MITYKIDAHPTPSAVGPVSAVLGTLAGHGFGTVEEAGAVEEHMRFALPRGLRPAGSRRDS